MNHNAKNPLWKSVEVTLGEVLATLRHKTWMTVPEVARRLNLLRNVYRERIRGVLRHVVEAKKAERRVRVRTGGGRGPFEYRLK